MDQALVLISSGFLTAMQTNSTRPSAGKLFHHFYFPPQVLLDMSAVPWLNFAFLDGFLLPTSSLSLLGKSSGSQGHIVGDPLGSTAFTPERQWEV